MGESEVLSNATELNVMSGITTTGTELNYLQGTAPSIAAPSVNKGKVACYGNAGDIIATKFLNQDEDATKSTVRNTITLQRTTTDVAGGADNIGIGINFQTESLSSSIVTSTNHELFDGTKDKSVTWPITPPLIVISFDFSNPSILSYLT